MKNLESLQRAFQRHVYRPGRVMERAVLATPHANAARRLGVYADGYRSRLVEALGNDYPALKRVLGESGFDRTMRRFIAAHPSRTRNLRWYGGDLGRFLGRSSRGRRKPLAELARFEWALGLAFDAQDAPLARAEDVARVPAADWPGMRLRLHSSVQLIWLLGNATLVWRKGHEPFYRVLSTEEAWALGAVARGRDFAALNGGLRRFVGAGHAAQTSAQFLRNWLAEGLISGVEPPVARRRAQGSSV